MFEMVEQLAGWRDRGVGFAVATVMQTLQSTPRPAGAAMAVSREGRVAGAISGGCVESAVIELAERCLADGAVRTETFGIGPGDPDVLAAPSLLCGGTIEVVVRRVDELSFPAFADWVGAVRAGEPVTLVTVVAGPDTGRHSVRTAAVCDVGVDLCALMTDLETGSASTVLLDTKSGQRCFVEHRPAPPRMVVVGAVDHAAALADVGRLLGFRVTVCDPRPAFATRDRIPGADEVVAEWPQRVLERMTLGERDAVCVLTHDVKFDVPALRAALATDAGFIGAMGSRRTHVHRTARLRAAGVGERDLARISSPIGLDLGGSTPAETAVSIAAEIVARRHGGSGRPLRDRRGAIHRTRSTDAEVALPPHDVVRSVQVARRS